MQTGHPRWAWLPVLILWALCGTAQAQEVNGVRFAERLTLDEVDLHLRGTDVLTWAMLFDVYAGAFYLPQGHPGAAWAEPVAKHLELSYFREIPGPDFVSSSDKLLRQNLTLDEYQAVETRLQTLYSLFRDVTPGDRYSLSFIPGRGTELRLNNALLGTIPGEDFARAYFGLWLGEQPIRESFRDRLLGLAP